MAVSRNNPPGGMGAVQNQTNSQSGSSVTSGTSTTTGSSRTVQNASETSTRTADYLDPTARAALNSLIQSLAGTSGGGGNRNPMVASRGGSSTSNTNAAGNSILERDRIRMQEILTNQGIRADYSKANAFADAQNAMNSNLTRALQQAMPTITAGIDAAGTSGSALSALLTQQAAEDAAGQAAELGLQAAINYGQIQTGQSAIIEGLLGQGSEVANALIQALGIAKGASEKVKTSTNSSSVSQTNSSQTTNSTQSTISNQSGEQSNVSTPTAATTAKKRNEPSGYGLLGSPNVTAMPGSAATRSSGQSYSQFTR